MNVSTSAGIFTVAEAGAGSIDIIGPATPRSQVISPQDAQTLAEALLAAVAAVNRDGAE